MNSATSLRHDTLGGLGVLGLAMSDAHGPVLAAETAGDDPLIALGPVAGGSVAAREEAREDLHNAAKSTGSVVARCRSAQDVGRTH